MARRKLTYKLIALLVVAGILSGCENAYEPLTSTVTSVQVQEEPDKEPLGMLSEAEINYEVPAIISSISVDRIGYDPEDEKLAIFHAKNLPAVFTVIDATNGDLIYTGFVKKTDCPEDADGLFTGVADFSSVKTEGTYYIKSDILGCSDDFKIKSGIVESLMTEAFLRLHVLRCSSAEVSNCHTEDIPFELNPQASANVSGGWHTGTDGQRDVVEGCLAALDLMQAYEYHPKTFSDNCGILESGNKIPDVLDEIKYEMDWLLKMQNLETGGVYSSVSMQTVGTSNEKKLVIGGESTRATCYFCAAMTRFSMVFKKYNSDYSSKCLKAATKAWKCLVANKALVSEEQMYRASAELYRVTGDSAYNDVAGEYIKKHAGEPYENRATLDAAIAYMSTTEKVNVKQCNLLISTMLDMVKEKAAVSKDARFLVEDDTKSAEALLRNTSELVIIDYIISNSEYRSVEKNYLHYFCGRNADSIIYKDLITLPDSYAMFIELLSRLADK